MKQLKKYLYESLQYIGGMNHVTIDEIKDYVYDNVSQIINDCELNAEIIDLYVHGSRITGNYKNDSDLDIVLYYKGNIKEDVFFNILHDEDYSDIFMYDDVILDINPIRDEETGSLKTYIQKDKNYRK